MTPCRTTNMVQMHTESEEKDSCIIHYTPFRFVAQFTIRLKEARILPFVERTVEVCLEFCQLQNKTGKDVSQHPSHTTYV